MSHQNVNHAICGVNLTYGIYMLTLYRRIQSDKGISMVVYWFQFFEDYDFSRQVYAVDTKNCNHASV